jgi:amidohydrolase
MIEKRVAQIKEELIAVRRYLHQYPETDFEEVKTSAYIKEQLKKIGIEPKGMAKTGVVGIITGEKPCESSPKTILIRADMDGLPILEDNALSFRSKRKGYMHACGHDVHTACLIGAARVLYELRGEFSGNVKLVFQPAEEGDGGALPMIEEGVLEHPHVDCAIALHVEPLAPVGTIQVKYGPIMASPDNFEVTVHGKGGHGAYPHECVDPIVTASMIINAYQTIVSRHFDPMTPAAVSVCSIQAGTCFNVIPNEAHFIGTARTIDHESRQKMQKLLGQIATNIAESMEAECDYQFLPLYPPLLNEKTMTDQVASAAQKLNCVDKIEWLEHPSMAGDDFSYFAERVPATYFKLGCGNDTICEPIHSSGFLVDEAAIPIGSAVLAQTVLDWFEQSKG